MRQRLFCGGGESTLFTSLGVTIRSFGEREDGQSLAYEVVALALIAFAVFGAISLVGRI
jgi:hypothetical protein